MTTYSGTYVRRQCDICKSSVYLPQDQTRCGWCSRGYAAALRDAVEAAKDNRYCHCGWCGECLGHRMAVAAIEALGGSNGN